MDKRITLTIVISMAFALVTPAEGKDPYRGIAFVELNNSLTYTPDWANETEASQRAAHYDAAVRHGLRSPNNGLGYGFHKSVSSDLHARMIAKVRRRPFHSVPQIGLTRVRPLAIDSHMGKTDSLAQLKGLETSSARKLLEGTIGNRIRNVGLTTSTTIVAGTAGYLVTVRSGKPRKGLAAAVATANAVKPLLDYSTNWLGEAIAGGQSPKSGLSVVREVALTALTSIPTALVGAAVMAKTGDAGKGITAGVVTANVIKPSLDKTTMWLGEAIADKLSRRESP